MRCVTKASTRFERTYPHSIDRVGEAVTKPEDLAHWFPSGVTHDARVGGTITSTGTILTFDPPTKFSFIWGRDELHFELEEIGESCKLILINVLSKADTAARNASGWTVCLAELDKLLVGVASRGPQSGEGDAAFEGIMATYIAAGMPAGAQIPGKKA